MKPAYVAVLSIAMVLVLVWLALALDVRRERVRGGDEARAAAPLGVGAGEGERERWSELEARLDELAAEVDALRDALDRLGAARTRAPAGPDEEREPAPSSPGQPTPEWYLEQYERSFDGGERGSEYFRLAVEAYAPELLGPIELRILSTAKPLAFRRALVGILGDRRFAKSARVRDLMLRLVATGDEDALIADALDALAAFCDAAIARALEPLVWSLETAALQRSAIQIVATCAGPDANLLLHRLMLGAPDDAMLAALVALLSSADPDSALDSFQLASQASQPVRLTAAHRVGEFRTPAMQDFVDRWAAVETDAAVLEALGRSRSEQRAIPRWSAAQATGAPDADASRDDPRAWASRHADMGEQWLELGYSPPMRAHAVRIHEVNAAGAVTAVVVLDEQGGQHAVWSGADPTTSPGVFELSFAPTSYRVARVRVVLDTSRTPGWNEIDAVEIVGPEGRAWASTATASSEYGR